MGIILKNGWIHGVGLLRKGSGRWIVGGFPLGKRMGRIKNTIQKLLNLLRPRALVWCAFYICLLLSGIASST